MKFLSALLFATISIPIFVSSIFCQSTITGIIKDAETQETIPYAVIKLESSQNYETSNLNGVFKITSSLKSDKIHISSLGYNSQTIEITKADTFLNVYLKVWSMNLGEVNVYANQASVNSTSFETLKRKETYSMAGSTKDIFRSVQMLPGVSENNAATAQYNVRGGTIDENLMLINGIELAEPYHIKAFPFASIGIFNIDMVERINFSAGGFSAEYGDALSSVLNVDYKKANNDSICGRVNMGMIDLGILTEIPLSNKASFLIAGRHSYLDPVIKLIDPEEDVSIRYYDIQGKFDYKINNRNSFSILGIYSQDFDKVGPEVNKSQSTYYGQFIDQPLTVNSFYDQNFLLDSKYNDVIVALMSKHNISGKVLLRSELSFYNEKENTAQTEYENVLREFSSAELFYENTYSWEDIKDYHLSTYEYKLSSEFLVSPNHKFKSGAYIRYSDYDYTRSKSSVWNVYNNTDSYPDTSDYVLQPDDADKNSISVFKTEAMKAGAYLSYQWQVNPELVLNTGGRMDYLNLNEQIDLSPRFNSSYTLNSKWKLNAAWGIFYKSPIMKQMKYSYASTQNTGSQQATHYVLGLERKHNNIRFKTEVFYKKYDDLIQSWRSPLGEMFYKTKENDAEGYAKGIEFELIATHDHFDFWLIYSLGTSKERLKETSTYYSRYTDQRHTLSSLFIFKMRKQKQIDLKISYGSGYAYKKQIFDESSNQWVFTDPIATEFLPYYSSIDIRFKKEFKLHNNPLQVYVDIVNIFNRKNAIGHRYSYNNNMPFEENEAFLGILPTFGVMYDF
jgi:outer membrane receptor for ferrienterochelin and colicin